MDYLTDSKDAETLLTEILAADQSTRREDLNASGMQQENYSRLRAGHALSNVSEGLDCIISRAGSALINQASWAITSGPHVIKSSLLPGPHECPVITLTDTAFLTRRLSLSTISYNSRISSFPPRTPPSVLAAAGCFGAASIADRRCLFPPPADGRGRAQLKGRWWSRKNLGYTFTRPSATWRASFSNLVAVRMAPSLPVYVDRLRKPSGTPSASKCASRLATAHFECEDRRLNDPFVEQSAQIEEWVDVSSPPIDLGEDCVTAPPSLRGHGICFDRFEEAIERNHENRGPITLLRPQKGISATVASRSDKKVGTSRPERPKRSLPRIPSAWRAHEADMRAWHWSDSRREPDLVDTEEESCSSSDSCPSSDESAGTSDTEVEDMDEDDTESSLKVPHVTPVDGEFQRSERFLLHGSDEACPDGWDQALSERRKLGCRKNIFHFIADEEVDARSGESVAPRYPSVLMRPKKSKRRVSSLTSTDMLRGGVTATPDSTDANQVTAAPSSRPIKAFMAAAMDRRAQRSTSEHFGSITKGALGMEVEQL
ncbi:hypothetical protein IE53DRAFT_377165 [Violaceomyces palustris]|uniref:Uncharacterized protein n=1 Tax=Violaceomyces palustris TaxID=1673888 RepID=A0ACD0P6I6_9BASI|nr:hypothetical protein IE53DRAFT_377165 [Violaceomyces palustris]